MVLLRGCLHLNSVVMHKLTHCSSKTTINHHSGVLRNNKGVAATYVTSISSSTNTSITTKMNSISEFYNGTNVLITGATGFLGKVLLEKLLRSCSGINCIYLLLRPKKGNDVKHRLNALLDSPVFQNLKTNNPKCLEKIRISPGDITEKNFGLNETDRKLLVDNVNIVLHSAATVNFTEKLGNAIMVNVLGTKHVVELCQEAKQLKSLVHVSTAYCNPDKEKIEEIVYDPPCNPGDAINWVRSLPPDILKENTKKLIGKHPVTYTFSKSLGESIILEQFPSLPATIVRPSIVNASWKEPLPGWTDSFGGATGLVVQCYVGSLKHFRIKNDIIADLIPVDVVANTIITSAWHSTQTRSNKLKVYNCVSSQTNPVMWGKCGNLVEKYAREYPTKYLIRYPNYNAISNKTLFTICNYLFNYIPAVCYDAILYFTGRKPRVVRFWKKAMENLETVEMATLENRIFLDVTFQNLLKAVKTADNGHNFDMDISKENGFDWNEYMKTYFSGIRKYIFKEDISDIDLAKVKLRRVYWAGKSIQLVWLLLILALLL